MNVILEIVAYIAIGTIVAFVCMMFVRLGITKQKLDDSDITLCTAIGVFWFILVPIVLIGGLVWFFSTSMSNAVEKIAERREHKSYKEE